MIARLILGLIFIAIGALGCITWEMPFPLLLFLGIYFILSCFKLADTKILALSDSDDPSPPSVATDQHVAAAPDAPHSPTAERIDTQFASMVAGAIAGLLGMGVAWAYIYTPGATWKVHLSQAFVGGLLTGVIPGVMIADIWTKDRALGFSSAFIGSLVVTLLPFAIIDLPAACFGIWESLAHRYPGGEETPLLQSVIIATVSALDLVVYVRWVRS
jgi:hypothetical protein